MFIAVFTEVFFLTVTRSCRIQSFPSSFPTASNWPDHVPTLCL